MEKGKNLRQSIVDCLFGGWVGEVTAGQKPVVFAQVAYGLRGGVILLEDLKPLTVFVVLSRVALQTVQVRFGWETKQTRRQSDR
jgi:NAD(P)H-dependent FMN reductase